VFTALLLLVIGSAMTVPPLVLDDFEDSLGVSTWGARWTGFTDRVMGGVSDMSVERHDDADTPHLHMTGEVRLENNGGFVQVALPLDGSGEPLDASAYRAIRLRVRGSGDGYYVHLRTDDTRRPWQHYAAPFEAPDTWTDVEIPFDRFTAQSLRAPLDTSALRRIGIVAAKQRMQADLSVARVELVP
jgi:hypothetical protein